MIDPLLGIVVATPLIDKVHKEHGKAVLLSLCQISRLFQWDPFLFLVSPEVAVSYQRNEKDKKWTEESRGPSALAAQEMQEAIHSNTEGRLLLVHLGRADDYIHPGLLPWVAIYGKHLVQHPTPILQILPLLLTNNSPVLIAASDGMFAEQSNAAESSWKNLMSQLKHDDKDPQ